MADLALRCPQCQETTAIYAYKSSHGDAAHCSACGWSGTPAQAVKRPQWEYMTVTMGCSPTAEWLQDRGGAHGGSWECLSILPVAGQYLCYFKREVPRG